jgi:hypothetical protein
MMAYPKPSKKPAVKIVPYKNVTSKKGGKGGKGGKRRK